MESRNFHGFEPLECTRIPDRAEKSGSPADRPSMNDDGQFRLYLIRHGQTAGNLQKRYIGVTDEALCAEGRRHLRSKRLISAPLVFSSPLKRCIQSAEILFPGKRVIILDDLRECDFGRFENRNYNELSGDLYYQAWIDSRGALPFPGGESREAFRARSLMGMYRILDFCHEYREKDRSCRTAAVVTHGGVIMNIMEAFFPAQGSFYDWNTKNGEGWIIAGVLRRENP